MDEMDEDFEQEQFDVKYDFYKSIAEENELKHSVWSIYEISDFTLVPFPQATKLRYNEVGMGVPAEVDLKLNSTWLDLWKAAEKAIELSKDFHHIYIEYFTEDGTTLFLTTGS